MKPSIATCFLFTTVLAGQHEAAVAQTTSGRALPQPPPAMPDVKTPFVEPQTTATLATESTRRTRTSTPNVAAEKAPRAASSTPRRTRASFTRVTHHTEANGALWAHGDAYKACFAADGATFIPFLGADAPSNFPVKFALESVTVGDASIAFDSNVTPQRTADRIVYDRGTLREIYDLRTSDVEQSFVFDALQTRGEIVVRVRVDSELERATSATGLSFSNEHGRVGLSKAVAIDADGERNSLDTRLVGDALEIRVPASVVQNARLPLVVDPLISTFGLATNSNIDLVPDVAYDVTTGRTCYVWESAYSAIDHDVWCEVYDASGAFVGGDFIDGTADDWRNPKVANNNFANNFLVVAEAALSVTTRVIVSRTVTSDVVVGTTMVLSTGAAGIQVLPDVGGDFYAADGSTFFGVVWQRNMSATDTDILFRLVDDDGTPFGSINFLSNASGTLDKHPTISKGTGDGSNAFQGWNIAFDHQIGSGQRDIWGAQVNWDGTVASPPFSIIASLSDDAWPSASTCLSRVNGADYWMVACQRSFGTNDHDIVAAVLSGNAVQIVWDLSDDDGSDYFEDQIAASVDSDGRQFIVANMESYLHSTTDLDIYISEWAFAAGALYPSDTHVLVAANSTYEAWPQIAAEHSSGGTGPCAAIVWADDNGGNSDVYGGRYCGRVGGGQVTFCFGDGSSAACPCGAGSAGFGCPNSVNPSGAALVSTGNSSLSNDTFVLTGYGMPSVATCLYFQGTAPTGGAAFGDGVRCVAGTVIRLGTKTNAGGFSQYPTGADSPVSVRGLIPAVGGARFYQTWYRNSATFCTSATFNVTNAVRAVWVP